MTFLNFSQLSESVFRPNFSGNTFLKTKLNFPLTGKCFPLTNFSNGKQTQESLKSNFPETTFRKTNTAWENTFLKIKPNFSLTGKCFPLTGKCFRWPTFLMENKHRKVWKIVFRKLLFGKQIWPRIEFNSKGSKEPETDNYITRIMWSETKRFLSWLRD